MWVRNELTHANSKPTTQYNSNKNPYFYARERLQKLTTRGVNYR